MTVTTMQRLRRGLPRTPQGEPWPPADSPLVDQSPVPEATAPSHVSGPAPNSEPVPMPVSSPAQVGTPAELRRGLPRTPGGEPWPPEYVATQVEPIVAEPQPVTAPTGPTRSVTLRRGLPRTPGGEAWPEVTEIAVAAPATDVVEVATPVEAPQPAPAVEKPKAEAKRYGPFTLVQWIGGGVVAVLGIIVVAAAVVLGARWFLGTDTGSSFVETYPGAAPMPESAPVGVPGWLAWSHFFNLFLMVLIIRSGLQIRNERRPTAYWASRRGAGRKISLTVWFHQSLDLLWITNGIVFFILLFATGQWMRVVPTSWEVLPNSLSAGLHYLSLDWPAENGWVHYNGLQQLAYFATIFIAAPLAMATGFRMSGLWSAEWEKLSRIYPVEVARKLHFPVMLYFVFFIVTHVLLVFATGALRNLNHMFAAQGSTDPAVYADNWTGFWLFVLGMVLLAGAWIAARPMILAPVAKLFGTVSAR